MTLEQLFNFYMTFPAFSSTILKDVNQKGDFGDAPLHLAAGRGVADEILLLVENGADIEMPGELGATPLNRATLMGHLEAVKILLRYNANPLTENADGKSSLDYARDGAKYESVEKYSDILNLLKSRLEV